MKDIFKIKRKKRQIRHGRVRAKVFGTKKRPRMSIYRSLNNCYVQLIDDDIGKTLIAFDDRKIKGNKTKRAEELGKKIAQLAKDKKITSVVFDRGGFKYQGRVKAVAESARAAGLKF